MKQTYPTFILNVNDGSKYPFLAYVPDMEIFTEGETFTDAIRMARDAIGSTGVSMEDNREEISAPSDQIAAIKACQHTAEVDFSKGVLTYLDVDFTEYRKQLARLQSKKMWSFQAG